MKKYVKLFVMTVLALSLTACGGAEEETVKETETVVESETEAVLNAYGEDVEGAWKIQIKNSTGAEIKTVAVRKTGDTEFGDNLLTENAVIATDEEVVIYYVADIVEETEEASEDAKALNETYDVSIILSDDTSYVLTAFPFEDMEACEIKVEDEVAFVEYESLSTKETISTKEAELAIKEAETEEVYYEEDDYSYDNDYIYEEPSVDQGSDSCLGGAELNTPSVDQGSDSCLGGAELNTPSVDQGADDCLSDDAMTW